jgi:hypothetical protein
VPGPLAWRYPALWLLPPCRPAPPRRFRPSLQRARPPAPVPAARANGDLIIDSCTPTRARGNYRPSPHPPQSPIELQSLHAHARADARAGLRGAAEASPHRRQAAQRRVRQTYGWWADRLGMEASMEAGARCVIIVNAQALRAPHYFSAPSKC